MDECTASSLCIEEISSSAFPGIFFSLFLPKQNCHRFWFFKTKMNWWRSLTWCISTFGYIQSGRRKIAVLDIEYRSNTDKTASFQKIPFKNWPSSKLFFPVVFTFSLDNAVIQKQKKYSIFWFDHPSHNRHNCMPFQWNLSSMFSKSTSTSKSDKQLWFGFMLMVACRIVQ